MVVPHLERDGRKKTGWEGEKKTNICSNKRESESEKENKFNLGKRIKKSRGGGVGEEERARIFWRREGNHYRKSRQRPKKIRGVRRGGCRVGGEDPSWPPRP